MKSKVIFTALFITFGALAQAQGIKPHNIANITGTGATVQVYAAGGLARAVQFIAPAGNAATVQLGDSTTTSTTGNPVAAGGGYYCQPLPPVSGVPASTYSYGLGSFYAYIANGDKLTVVAYW